jgi:hypothetical protein
MPRGRKKEVSITAASQLLAAVKFVGLVCKDKGSVNDQFCMISKGWLVANNGTVAMGIPIPQTITAAPHNKRLEAALAGCTADNLTLTQLVGDRLHVRSGDFEAYVPCCPESEASKLLWAKPDAPITALDNPERSFPAAIKKCAVLATAKAKTVLTAAIVLNNGCCISTNNTCIIEAWHGYSMRDGIAVPEQFVATLNKVKAVATAIGYSETTFTIHFNGCWLRTGIFSDKLPDLREYLNKGQMQNATAPPVDFFTVVGKLVKFAYDGMVYCDDGAITAYDNANEDMSAEGSYEVLGAPNGLAFNANDLMTIAPHVQLLDFRALPNGAMFYGSAVRGAVVWKDTMPKPVVKVEPPEWKPAESSKCYECGKDWPNASPVCPHCGSDIPF